MFTVEDHGSLMLFRPLDAEVTAWLEEHTDGHWFGGALAVEPRFAEALALGMLDAGFTFA
jgi:hypothetical protein